MTIDAARLISFVLLLSAAYPLWVGWRSLSGTALRHAFVWLIVAWLGWLASCGLPLLPVAERPLRYLALALTACFVVAVLGARRPGLHAWNFVVAALVLTLLLPMLQQPWTDESFRLEHPWDLFLSAILAAGCLNYLPTRWHVLSAFAALFLLFQLVSLTGDFRLEPIPKAAIRAHELLWLLILVAWGCFAGVLLAKPSRSATGDVWRRFRDCYGLVWGKRVQEQFNAASKNAGWRHRLKWFKGVEPEPGHPPPTAAEEAEMLRTLQALLRPFGVLESN